MFALSLTIVGFFIFIIIIYIIRTIVIIPDRDSKILEFIRTKHYKEAEFIIYHHLKRKPDDPKLLFLLAEILWATNQLNEAGGIYESLKEDKSKENSNYYHTVLFRLATLYKNTEYFDQAYFTIEKLLNLCKNKSEYYLLMGEILLAQDNPHQAIIYFKLGLEIDKNNILLWTILADTYYNNSQFSEAFHTYSHVINLEPKNTSVWFYLGKLSESLDNLDKAIKFYRKAEQLSDTVLSYDIAFHLGSVLIKSGDKSNGILVLERTRALLKEYPDIEQSKILSLRYQLAESYLLTDHIELAIKEWVEITYINPYYLDVLEKLKIHSISQLNELLKDMLTLNDSQLVQVLCDFVQSLGFIVDIYYINGEAVDIIASDSLDNWRDVNRRKTIFSFWCSDFNLPSNTPTKIQEYLDTANISRAYIISGGPILSDIRSTLNRKSIHFFDRNNIQELLNVSKTFKLSINEQKKEKIPIIS